MSVNFLVRNLVRNLNVSVHRKSNNLCNFRNCSRKIVPRTLHTTNLALKKSEVTVVFIRADGERMPVKAKIGDSLLDAVVDNSLDIDGYGACEGTLTCSTCHVILKKEDFDRLPEKPLDEELDMLDLAHGLCDTSRLGCQISLTEDLDGLEITLPASINDARK